MNTQYHSVREVARYFGVSRGKIYELVKSGSLAHTMLNGLIRISKKDIENFEKRNHRGIKRKERVYPF